MFNCFELFEESVDEALEIVEVPRALDEKDKVVVAAFDINIWNNEFASSFQEIADILIIISQLSGVFLSLKIPL